MKHALLLLALAPLGCAASQPEAAAPAGPSAEPVVVDLAAAPPPPARKAAPATAPPAPEATAAADAQPPPDAAEGTAEANGHLVEVFGRTANGPDVGQLGATGSIWGDSIGDSFGAGGLGLSGVGPGGGGRGEGIGLGSIGTKGHGSGQGTGAGFGNGRSRLAGDHTTEPPTMRMGALSVAGRLPPEVVQRIVRQSFGRIRLCYENGLRANARLAGRVSVRFEILPDGSVGDAGDAGSDLPDAGVIGCIVRSARGMSFPQPEDSQAVQVIFPVVLSPPAAKAPAPPAKAPPAAKPAPGAAGKQP